MNKRCPDCDAILEHVKVDGMGSAPNLYRCGQRCLMFEQDTSGLLTETDD